MGEESAPGNGGRARQKQNARARSVLRGPRELAAAQQFQRRAVAVVRHQLFRRQHESRRPAGVDGAKARTTRWPIRPKAACRASARSWKPPASIPCFGKCCWKMRGARRRDSRFANVAGRLRATALRRENSRRRTGVENSGRNGLCRAAAIQRAHDQARRLRAAHAGAAKAGRAGSAGPGTAGHKTVLRPDAPG